MTRKIKIHGLHLRNLRGDIFGGVTAAIVALPLALAFGVSSGAGATAGLYGAIAIGFFAALFGGTPSQISGPTGPMTVVMATVFTGLIAKYPDNGVELAFTVVMLGGLFQIGFGLLRLGEYITLMPYTVISGFMSGIGVIIFTLQFAPLFGQEGSANVVDSIQSLPSVVSDPNWGALSLGLLTLAIVFGMPARMNRILPAPLVALVVGTVASLFMGGDTIPRIGTIPSSLPDLHLPVFDPGAIRDMLGYGLVLATLGSIDSLLTSLVADNITRTQHDSDRELIGQGIGNMLSGLVGGLPGAGATMRTVINVKSGGQTPLSGMVHASLLVAVLLGAGSLTAQIPLAVLAGILIKVGIDVIDWSFLKRAHVVSRKAALLMYGVLLLTVFVDLITAVAAGAFVANLLTVKKLTDEQRQHVHAITTPTDESLTEEERRLLAAVQGRVLLFRLSGPMSFGAAKTISQRMTIVNRYEVLILDLADVPRLGVTASLAVENMVKEACDRHLMVFVVGAQGAVKERLSVLHVFDDLPAENLLSSRLMALQKAAQDLSALSPGRTMSQPVPMAPASVRDLRAKIANADPSDRVSALKSPPLNSSQRTEPRSKATSEPPQS
ncbi:MAG: SulP family inorganic anion transporter [Cyanobacteria bacterium J06632_3]